MPAPIGTSSNSPDAWQYLPAPLGEHAMDAARTKLMAGLAAGSERQRAAALLLQFFRVAPDPALRVHLAAQLGTLARAARDPAVWAWTLSMCEFDTQACDADAARQWIESERDNAAAWISLARRKGIPADDIDPGLAQATRYSVHYGAFAATVRDAWPATEPPYVQVALLVEALAIDSALAVPLLQGTSAHCKPPPPAGSLRLSGCRTLAESMVQRGDTLIGHTLGAAIGEKVGWSAARVAALRDENRALLAGQLSFEGEQQVFSCESVERLRNWVDDVARLGEVSNARARRKSPR